MVPLTDLGAPASLVSCEAGEGRRGDGGEKDLRLRQFRDRQHWQ